MASAKKLVLEKYLELGKLLGIQFGLAKSIMSPVGVIEFAKKFVTPRGDCSPVSIGELLVSKVSFPVMVN